jgi:hypothetical protein
MPSPDARDWHYEVIPHAPGNVDRTRDYLNRQALAGWELVTATDRTLYFRKLKGPKGFKS